MVSLELRILWFMFGLVLGFILALVISFYFMKRIFDKLFNFRKRNFLQDGREDFKSSVGINNTEEPPNKVFLEEFSPEKIKDYAFNYFMKNIVGFDNSSNPSQDKP